MNVIHMRLRDGAVRCQRHFSLLSNISKKTQEAVDKTKAAAEELHKASNTAKTVERVKQQAAAASSVLSDTVSQAQGLAKETMGELFGGKKPSKEESEKKKKTEGSAAASDKGTETSSSTSSSGAGGKEGEQGPSSSNSAGGSTGSAAGGGLSERVRAAALDAILEMRAAVLPETPSASALRGASAKKSDIQTSATSDIMVAPAPEEGAWQKQWREMRDKLGGHPFFAGVVGLKDSRIFGAGRDAAEAVRERWETSDSPLVHKIQDAADSFFAEGEAAAALREIRARDPAFDMVRFLQHLKADVPVVIGAYLRGEEETIKAHCSPEMIERLTGIIKAQAAAGIVPDPTLLDTSEVELVDLKMLDDAPVVVAQFTCQQINCSRDAHGNVVEGAPDEVHRVYYYWALQQEATGYVGEDGQHHPPRWQLREMLIRGMHHLL